MLLSVYSIHFSRRERSKVPYIVRQCLEEIERRGMEEVGIYRVSGVATDIQALKTAFDTSQHSLLLFPVTHNHPQCLLGALVYSGFEICHRLAPLLQIIKMCRWSWARWTSMPSLGPWSSTSESCQSRSSLTSFTPTLQAASVSHYWSELMISNLSELYLKEEVFAKWVGACFLSAALSDSVAKESCMLNLLLSLPEPNLVTFLFLLDHLKR